MSRNRCLLIAIVVAVVVALVLLELLPGRAPAAEPGGTLAGDVPVRTAGAYDDIADKQRRLQ